MTNLANSLIESARIHPDRPAIRQDDLILSYADLDAGSAIVAAAVRHRGIGPGDRVAVMLPNVAAFPVLYYGLLRAGRRRRSDESAADGPRGHALPGRLRSAP